MAGNDRFGNAVIVERLCRAGEKGRPVLDMPLRDFLAGAHIFPIAPDKQRQLQRRARPQIGPLLADVAAGIGKGQRVREIEPADIVGNRIAGGALESHVEM